jgi:hypothetical protein
MALSPIVLLVSLQKSEVAVGCQLTISRLRAGNNERHGVAAV